MPPLAQTVRCLPLLGVLLAAPAHAVLVLGNGDSINLAELMASNDRSFIVNDKLFRFEAFSSSQSDASLYNVVGFVSLNPNQFGQFNVGFDLIGPFGDGTPGDGVVHELNLQYEVSVLPEFYAQGVRLCDARLTFNGSAGADGSFARVDETIFDLDANQFLGNMATYDIFGPPRETLFSTGLDFCEIFGTDGYRAFEVNKDMKFFAATADDFATASFIRQEFSQIPAPGAVALLGAAGLAARRRRA
jgi:hypothetical protein